MDWEDKSAGFTMQMGVVLSLSFLIREKREF